MNIRSLIEGSRKLGNFLVTLFPPLARVGAGLGRALRWLVTNPVTAPYWQRFAGSRQGKAVIDLFERFWWRDYAKHRLDWGNLPPGSLALLRPVFLLGLALCLLIPLAMAVPRPALPPGGLSEAQGPVAAWSVLIWLLTASVSWGCLLAGGGLSNRLALVAASFFTLWELSNGAFFRLGPSWWNLAAPLAVLLAVGLAERQLGPPAQYRQAVTLGVVLPLGVYLGLVTVGLTPLTGILRGWWGVPARFLVGATLVALAVAWGRWSGRSATGETRAGTLSPAFAAGLLAVPVLVLYLSLGWRGGLDVPAEAVRRCLLLWTGYLWPLWYLVGAGIIIKVLGQSRSLTEAAQNLLPGRWFPRLVLLLLGAGTVAFWSEWVLEASGLPWPRWFYQAMGWIYHWTGPLIWHSNLTAWTADLVKWVLLLALGTAVFLEVRRRFTADRAAALLAQVLLLWFLLAEYFLQYVSFERSGINSAFLMLLLGLSLMWLFYTTGADLSRRSSPRWPAAGRLALFGGLFLFVLLDIHSRAALHDAQALDVVFFSTFRGLLEFGVPYWLFLYAGRSVARLPVRLPRLIGAYAAGAAGAALLNAADKLAVAGGALDALRADVAARLQAVLSGNSVVLGGMAPDVPPAWLLVRAALVVVGLLAIGRWARARHADEPDAPAAALFLVVAASLGLASFSLARLELPMLSPAASLLLSPYRFSVEFDAHTAAVYLTCLLGGLIVGLSCASLRTVRCWCAWAGLALSYAFLAGAMLIWPAGEAWLEASGLVWTAGIAGLGLLLLLIREARRRVDESASSPGPPGSPRPPAGEQISSPGPPAREHQLNETECPLSDRQGLPEAEGSPGRPAPELPLDEANGSSSGRRGLPEETPALGPRGLAVLVALAGLALLALGTYQAVRGWPVERQVRGLGQTLPLPRAWQPLTPAPPGPAAAFFRKSITGFNPVLVVNILPPKAVEPGPPAEPGEGPATGPGNGGSAQPGTPLSVDDRLRAFLPLGPREFPGFDLIDGPRAWDREFRGARALTFSFHRPGAGGVEMPTGAVLVLAPLSGGRALSLLMLSDPADLDARRWDLRFALQRFRPPGPPRDSSRTLRRNPAGTEPLPASRYATLIRGIDSDE